MKNRKRTFLMAAAYIVILLFMVYIALMYLEHGVANAPIVRGKLHDSGFSLTIWESVFYPHIALGSIALAIGPIQFLNRRRGGRQWHRWLGRVYAFAIGVNILVVPYMAMFATGGRPSGIAFLILDAFWLWTTAMGVWQIRQRNISAHRRWIVRSYAITWVFVSFRVVMLLVSLLTHAPESFSFPLSVYVSIALNLLIVEWALRGRRKRLSAGVSAATKAV